MLTLYIISVLFGWSVSCLLGYLQDDVTVSDIVYSAIAGLVPIVNIGIAVSMLGFIANQTKIMDKVVFRRKK